MRRITSSALRAPLRRIRMSNDVHWITARIAEARRRHASVTDAVAVGIADLLNGKLRERRLSSTELTSVARVLIADMVTASAKAEMKQ